jgi:hypothetical protein
MQKDINRQVRKSGVFVAVKIMYLPAASRGADAFDENIANK